MKNMRVLVHLNFFNTKMIEIIHQNMQQQQYFMVFLVFFFTGVVGLDLPILCVCMHMCLCSYAWIVHNFQALFMTVMEKDDFDFDHNNLSL